MASGKIALDLMGGMSLSEAATLLESVERPMPEPDTYRAACLVTLCEPASSIGDLKILIRYLVRRRNEILADMV